MNCSFVCASWGTFVFLQQSECARMEWYCWGTVDFCFVFFSLMNFDFVLTIVFSYNFENGAEETVIVFLFWCWCFLKRLSLFLLQIAKNFFFWSTFVFSSINKCVDAVWNVSIVNSLRCLRRWQVCIFAAWAEHKMAGFIFFTSFPHLLIFWAVCIFVLFCVFFLNN